VTSLSGSDADGDSISYAITAGNSEGIFAISGATLIVADRGNLDYESMTGYVLTI
jgi:hypothetical protein